MLAQNLSLNYNDSLLFLIENVEEVLRYETTRMETLLFEKNFSEEKIIPLITDSDISMQKLSWITHQHMQNISKYPQEDQRNHLFEYTAKIWNQTYLKSIESIKKVITPLAESSIPEFFYTYVINLCEMIAKNRLMSCQILGYNYTLAEQTLHEALSLFQTHQFNEGLTKVVLCISLCETLLFQE